VCLGKYIGGGLPIGAIAMRHDLGTCFALSHKPRLGHGGTFNGSPLSMTAGIAALAGFGADRAAGLDAATTAVCEELNSLFARRDADWSVRQAGSLFHFWPHKNLPAAPGQARHHVSRAVPADRRGSRLPVRARHPAHLGPGQEPAQRLRIRQDRDTAPPGPGKLGIIRPDRHRMDQTVNDVQMPRRIPPSYADLREPVQQLAGQDRPRILRPRHHRAGLRQDHRQRGRADTSDANHVHPLRHATQHSQPNCRQPGYSRFTQVLRAMSA